MTAGFPQDCTLCHNTTQWTGATFNHTTTGFALTGTHATTQCAQCHVNNNYSLTSAACINCHQTDYNSTTNPPHKAAGFPQDCSVCHTTINWSGATFNHTTTGFALTGAHTSLQCAQCHVNNNFSLTSTACVTCHLNDYNGASRSAAQDRGLPAGLHPVPQHHPLDGRDLQPHHYGLRPHRHACHHAVRAVPRQQQLQPDQRRLHQLPPDRLQQHHRAEP